MNAKHSTMLLHGRSRAYGLMARLMLRGIDEVGWARLGEMPGVFESLQADADRDELAAEHHAAFSLGVFPYAGAFLSAEGKAGGRSDRVREFYAQAGFEPRLDEVAADHLGVVFAFLSFATGAQAEAQEDGQLELGRRLENLLVEFLDTCVLSWMPSLAVAMNEGSDFWRELVGVALGMAAEHRRQSPAPRPLAELPPFCSPLEDERNGLRDIAEFLLIPARCGVFLSREAIGRVGRRHDVPRGFGSRLTMLTNLLRSAAELGELSALMESLDAELATHRAGLLDLADTADLPDAVAPWCARIDQTRAVLRDLARHSRETERQTPTSARVTSPVG